LDEIGLKLKTTRESIDMTIEEVAEDIKYDKTEIENLEAGNIKAFNDVLRVKKIIEVYGKYLGLDYEDLVDEFNEYLFDFTSKISVAAIKKANKKADKEEKDKMRSPYTLDSSSQRNLLKIGIIIIVILLIVLFFLFREGII